MVSDPNDLEVAIEEASGMLRNVRHLRLNDENDFEVNTSERLANSAFDQLKYVKIATIVIGILTLIGAGIGLMNIMLVSVNERTREIGISKAIGATKRVIAIQFLTEAVVQICQIGGIMGIILGILMGNVVGLLIHFSYFSLCVGVRRLGFYFCHWPCCWYLSCIKSRRYGSSEGLSTSEPPAAACQIIYFYCI